MLKNDVKNRWGNYEGVYTFQEFSDGMDYWVDAKKEYAISYKVLRFLSLWNCHSYTTFKSHCTPNQNYSWGRRDCVTTSVLKRKIAI